MDYLPSCLNMIGFNEHSHVPFLSVNKPLHISHILWDFCLSRHMDFTVSVTFCFHIVSPNYLHSTSNSSLQWLARFLYTLFFDFFVCIYLSHCAGKMEANIMVKVYIIKCKSNVNQIESIQSNQDNPTKRNCTTKTKRSNLIWQKF